MYYVSKILMVVETRYLKIEKLAHALLIATRKLQNYFLAHPIFVLTDQPLKQILQWSNTSGRLLKWSIELSEFYIDYRSRMAIKAQALADFIAEFTHDVALEPKVSLPKVEASEKHDLDKNFAKWKLFVDGSCNQHGCGVRLVLQTPSGEQMEYAIRIRFKTTKTKLNIRHSLSD